MKKILLSLLALVAMAGMANAQRAWAYDLGLGYESDTYTFTFKATTAANATLIFTDAEGVELATHDAGAVVAGSNTIALTKEQLPKGTEIHWAVKMAGSAIALSGSYLTELTAAGQGLDFYLPQGLVVDNNPESETFSTLFIAEAQGGKLSVGSTHKQGIYHYSQTLTELNPTDQGIIPSNVTLTNGSRQEMHRIAINPKNNHVAFAHNVSGKAAVWSVPANNPAGEATNLIAGTSITMPNSICFDENGVLYVMDNANATTGGTLYKVVDGVATKLVQNKTWQQVDNSLAYDGRGGIWIAQTSDSNTWPSYAILSHVNSKGEIDWSALDHGSDGLFSAGNSFGYSQRGQCAYNAKEDLLVLGGNCRSHIFQVTYDVNTGVPSVSLKYRTPFIKASTNIDGAAFDYAGDLYLMSAARERLYKYVVPTDNNTCITPAPKAQVIINSDEIVLYAITATPNNEAMGTVTGAGTYVEGTEVTLTATPITGYEFVNWSNGETANPLVFTATEDVELTANFKALQYTVTVGVNDETKGSVTNAGEHTLDYGTELVLKATPAEGYRFAKWSNEETANPLTITVSGDLEITALFENANITARAWAYDLSLETADDTYTLSFKATTPANATIIFTNAEGEEVGTHELGAIAAGANKISLTTDQLPEASELYWAVKMAYDDVIAIREVTDQSRGIYDFYNMMDVLVDNNPESNYFGEIYVQMALAGTTKGKTQTPGLFIFNQELNLLNESPNAGIQPTLPDGYTMGGDRNKFHRLDIDPKTGNLTYCYNISNKPAVFAMDRANLTGEVTNLVAGIDGLLRTSAHCFDADGTLYVYDYDARVSGSEKAIIYKIKDGVKTQLTEATTKFVQNSVTLASDGKDGLWVGQNRGAMDGYYQLVHVTAAGELDYIVNSSNTHGFTGFSSRGALAYDAERHILAQGRNGAVELFSVTYNAETGVPTLTKFATTPYVGNNIDGLHFDYAGDLYVVNSSTEKFQKFVVPTNNNTCTTPAPKAQVITLVSSKEHTITVAVTPAESGIVEGLAANGIYEEGDKATLTAKANKGYEFVNWTVDNTEVSKDATYSFEVTENLALVANFTKKVYTVTATAENGTVEGLAADGKYEHGAEATLTATPAEGYEFVNWTKGEEVVSTENPYKFTVTADVALVANFKLIPPTKYNVTVTAENGTVTGAGEYEEGKEATLTATPAEGYEFVNWTKGEEVVSTENPYKFTVTADVALVANFKLIPPTKYNVTVTAENGTVTGAGEYEEGAEATLTATAAEGYEFTCWTSGKDTVSTANPYKFTVTADLALVANFKKAITTITKTFAITQEEDTRKMGGTYLIYADDDYTLRIFGYNGAGTYQDDPTTEEDAAPMLFTPDYDDALNAVVVVTLDNENKKEVMQVTATSEDGSTIYNLTINIALPSYETYSLVATGVKAENGEVEGMPIISLKGEGLQNGEEKVPFDFMVFESAEGYMAEGTVGEIYVFSTVAEFFAENGEFNFMATMQDEESKYLFNVDINGTMAQPEVEIVVKEEVNVTLYNLTVDVQGTMAMVSAGTEELSFWLTLLQTENHYGDYTNDAFSNIWYGDDQLYAAYGEKHTYDVTDGKVNFVVSFITTPDAEGNVTKYNFTLYAGEKPSDPTALDNISIEGKAAKAIINGQLIIVKDGVQYNAQGAVVK